MFDGLQLQWLLDGERVDMVAPFEHFIARALPGPRAAAAMSSTQSSSGIAVESSTRWQTPGSCRSTPYSVSM